MEGEQKMIDEERVLEYLDYLIEAIVYETHSIEYFDAVEQLTHNNFVEGENADTITITIELKRLPEKKKENKINYEIGVKLDNDSLKDTLDAFARNITSGNYEGISGPHREY